MLARQRQQPGVKLDDNKSFGSIRVPLRSDATLMPFCWAHLFRLGGSRWVGVRVGGWV